MIRIKDYIFNENEILYITEQPDDMIYIIFKDDIQQVRPLDIKATFEDIEWNYGTQKRTQEHTIRKGVCDKNKKPLLTIEDIQLYIKELEEENKKLKDELEKRKRINGEIPKVIENAGLDYYNEKLKKRIIKLEDKIKELEEENKRLNFCMKDTYNSANDICSELQQRIDKAIKYLKLKVDIPKNHLEEAIKDREEDLLKILGGEEND